MKGMERECAKHSSTSSEFQWVPESQIPHMLHSLRFPTNWGINMWHHARNHCNFIESHNFGLTDSENALLVPLICFKRSGEIWVSRPGDTQWSRRKARWSGRFDHPGYRKKCLSLTKSYEGTASIQICGIQYEITESYWRHGRLAMPIYRFFGISTRFEWALHSQYEGKFWQQSSDLPKFGSRTCATSRSGEMRTKLRIGVFDGLPKPDWNNFRMMKRSGWERSRSEIDYADPNKVSESAFPVSNELFSLLNSSFYWLRGIWMYRTTITHLLWLVEFIKPRLVVSAPDCSRWRIVNANSHSSFEITTFHFIPLQQKSRTFWEGKNPDDKRRLNSFAGYLETRWLSGEMSLIPKLPAKGWG
jgi:hypothetical protein